MELNIRKILFLAVCDGSGVEKKIEGLCKAAIEAGYATEKMVRSCKGLSDRRQLMCHVLTTDAKYVVLRSMSSYSIFFLLLMLKARMQGKIIIVDQASPLNSYIYEINGYKRSFRWKLSKKMMTYIGGPLFLGLASRVIQYANESVWFEIFCRRKTILMANGIDIDRISQRDKNYPDGINQLSIVGVSASIANWHGYDRIIRAMSKWKQMGGKPAITLDLVGNDMNEDSNNLKRIIKQMDLEKEVHFWGFQPSGFLSTIYGKSCLAVASLGLFRNGLSMASVLKAREYCLAGIPFIAAGNDPDFPSDTPFRFEVSNDNDIDDIINVFKTFAERRKTFTDEDIREYALRQLSFKNKFKQMMQGL